MSEQEEFEFRARLEREAKPRNPKELTASEQINTDPTGGMSTTDKVLAGAGKAFTDIGRGAGQLIGKVSRNDIDEARKLEAPLMKSGAGQAGYIGGGMVPLAALSLVPGANTITGAALLGGATGALEPVGTGESKLSNIALGGAVGGGSAAALKGVGAGVSKLLQSSEQKVAATTSQNAVRDSTIREAQAAGYVLPPTVTGGGGGSKLLESIAGKASVGQEASIRNQQVTNKIARVESGLGPSEPITERSLAAARERIAEPYREVERLASNSPLSQPPFKSPGKTLEELKQVRADAQAEWKFYSRAADPKTLKEAQRLDARANLLEDQIEAVAKQLGKPELVDSLRAARVQLAKNYNVESALVQGSGDIDAATIGRLLDKKGEKAVTGGLQTIGKFQQAFSTFAREKPVGQSAPGVNYLKYPLAIGLGLEGYREGQAHGVGPYGAAAGLLALGSGPARSIALSKLMQSAPTYKPGMAIQLSDLATNNPQLRGMIPLSAASSVLQGQQQ